MQIMLDQKTPDPRDFVLWQVIVDIDATLYIAGHCRGKAKPESCDRL